MRYAVRVIPDEVLPEGTDWALVEVDGTTMFLCKQAAYAPQALADAWAAFRHLDRAHTPCRQLLPARPFLQIAR